VGDDVIPVTLHPIQPCDLCGRRPEEMTVVIEDRVVAVCSTCFERAEDERRRP
jgi:ribosome-binding protein aMBF1 (putative translation factor)